MSFWIPGERSSGLAGMVIDDLRNGEDHGRVLVLGNSAWRADWLCDLSWDAVIVCNYAYRDITSATFVCAMDPTTILEILCDPRLPEQAMVVTPVELGKQVYQKVITERFITHYAVEGRFAAEPMTGCMAIGLAGWLGASHVVLSGFSADASHVSPEELAKRNPTCAEGQAETELKAMQVGVAEYRRLVPDGRLSVAVDPDWFLATRERRT